MLWCYLFNISGYIKPMRVSYNFLFFSLFVLFHTYFIFYDNLISSSVRYLFCLTETLFCLDIMICPLFHLILCYYSIWMLDGSTVALLPRLLPNLLHQPRQMYVGLMRLMEQRDKLQNMCGRCKVNEGWITVGNIQYVYEPQLQIEDDELEQLMQITSGTI